jgi:single-strand DNA-binding protein
MRGFNQINITGNLTNEPKKVGEEENVTVFSVAVNEKYGDNESTEYFSCVAFNGLGGVIHDYFAKGDGIVLGGRVNTRKYTDSNDEEQEQKQLIVNDFAFPGSGFNSVTLAGRSTSEGELKWVNSKYDDEKRPIFNFNLAVNRRYNGKDYTDFIQVTLGGDMAESLADNLEKGSPILVNGRLKVDRVKQDDDSTKIYPSIQVNNYRFLKTNNNSNDEEESKSSKKKSQKEEQPEEADLDGDLEMEDDEELFSDEELFN